MRKHNFKRSIAGILALAMMIPAAVSISEPICASAGEILGETSFTYKMLPWHAVETSPARQYFEVADGAVHITIMVPEGAEHERWDLQFRHRNLCFKKGHEYKVSFRVKSSRYGFELCSKISSLTGDEEYFELDGQTNDMHMGPHMGGQWPAAAAKLTTDWQKYEGIFIPTEDIDGAQWCFEYARGTQYQGNAREGDELWFDDMSIYDMTEDISEPPAQSLGYTARGFSGLENNYISVNQLGYYQGLEKTATLGDNYGDLTNGSSVIKLDQRYTYEIVNVSDDKAVYTGMTGKPETDKDSGDKICKIDFTEFDEEGEYYIRIKDKEWRSFPFRIGNDIYSDKENDLLTNALNYFYQNRGGTKIESKYITSGDKDKLAHEYDRDESNGRVMNQWKYSYSKYADDVILCTSSETDTSGGWFTGTDFDKNMLEGGISVWTLQNMYERAVQKKAGVKKFADGSGTVVIPESGNKVPDILDECRYELDFMSKMKVSPDEETWGDYAGLYYHRMQGVGYKADPEDYEHDHHATYCVSPPTFAATLNYAACAAQGARLWKPYDAEYAEELMTSAKEAYAAYKKYQYKPERTEEYNPTSLYSPLYDSRYSCYDPEQEVLTDAYWAACELYISAAEMKDPDADTYLDDLCGSKYSFDVPIRINGGYNEVGDGSYTLFNGDNPTAAGSMSLMLHKELLTDEQKENLESMLIYAASNFIYKQEAQGYGIPYIYDGPGYGLPMGLEFTVRRAGFEKDSNKRAINNLLAMAYAYDMTGETKYINGVAKGMDYLLGNNPLAFSYITGYGSYCVKNPSHRYWQYELNKSLPQAPDGVLVCGPNCEFLDPYAKGLGFTLEYPYDASERYYADSVEEWSTNETSVSMNASLAWIVSFLQDEAVEQAVTGDVNDDGELTMADMVLLRKWLLAVPGTKLENWEAADFSSDGKLDIFDLCLMKDEIIKKKVPLYVEPEVRVEYGMPFDIGINGSELYAGPDESYPRIALIPAFTSLNEKGYQLSTDKWLFTEYNGQYGWVKNDAFFFGAMGAKPVIYLYPEEETDVHVELELTESELYTTYPKYNNGWDVTAYPDGTILNKADGTHHKYLFWDSANCRTRYDYSKGFCVAGSDTESFLKEKLTYMGLTEEEMNEFIIYWLPLMEHNKYNLITFQGEAYTDSSKLSIEPAPDSLLRIFMVYVPLENAVEIEPQQLETFERNGFTVIEWGGSEIRA